MNGSKLEFDSAVTEIEADLFVRIIQIVMTAVSTATRVRHRSKSGFANLLSENCMMTEILASNSCLFSVTLSEEMVRD